MKYSQGIINTSNIAPLTHKMLSSSLPLAVASIVLILNGMCLRDPWPADEPRFALVAKEMVETGQWFFPARAQELYPDKPPVFMWAIAFFYWLTGSLRVSFLLPSALSGLLTIFLVTDIGKRLWNKQTGIIAGWLLLLSFQFMLQSKTAQIDATVCALIMLGCYGLLRFCLVDGQYKWYVVAWFAMGIGVITKGVGFLPMLMLIPYALYRLSERERPAIVNPPWWMWATGPVIMLSAIGMWFVPMLIIVASSENATFEIYRDNILFKQTVTRYTDSWHHIKPLWYYLTSVIPVFWLPLSLFIPWLLKPWFKAFKKQESRIMLPLAWCVLVVLFFSLSPGKRGVYILPALPTLALCIAPFYESLYQSKALKNLLFATSLIMGIVFFVIGFLGLLQISAVTTLVAKFDISPWYLFVFIGLVTISVTLGLSRLSKWFAWPVFFCTLWLSYSTYGYYLRNDVSTPVSLYDKAEQMIGEDSEIGLIDFSEQFILFSPFPIVHFGYHTDIQLQLQAAYQWQVEEYQYLLIEDIAVDASCFDVTHALDLGFAHRRHWLLLPAAAKKQTCVYEPSSLPVYRYTPNNRSVRH